VDDVRRHLLPRAEMSISIRLRLLLPDPEEIKELILDIVRKSHIRQRLPLGRAGPAAAILERMELGGRIGMQCSGKMRAVYWTDQFEKKFDIDYMISIT